MSDLHLVRDGKPVATVVLPDGDNPLTEQAVDFLVDCVGRMTGAPILVVREEDAGALSGTRVLLGATRAAREAGLDVSSLKDDGFMLRAQGNDLFVAGQDALFPSEPDINSFTACRGTLMGVFRLLEDFGGAGWYLPTPRGEVLPEASGFSVPGDLDRREAPAFSYISTTGVNGHGYRVWANGYRRAINMRTGVHTWDAVLHHHGDPDALFQKDPTIFALIDGERRLSYGRGVGRKVEPGDPSFQDGMKYRNLMLCTSHPAFVEMNVSYFSRLFDAGYTWAGYGQSDGYQPCECERCREMDGIDPSWWKGIGKDWNWDWEVNTHVNVPVAERLWAPLYEIARRLYERHPDRKLIALVYNPTYPPSRRVKAFPPNVAVELCRHTPAYLGAFSAFRWKTVYTYWFGTYRVQGITPKPLTHRIAEDMRRFRDNGVMGIHSTSGGEIWGLEGPAYYAYGRLAWDPDRDVDAVLDRYCRGVYGPAGPVMKAFFDLLEERIAAGDALQTPEERRINQEKMHPQVYFPAAYPETALAQLEGLLAQARDLARGDAVAQGWLWLTDLQFRYLRIVATGFNLQCRSEADPTPDLRRRFTRVAEERWTFLSELEDLRRDEARMRDWFPGWELYMKNAPSGGTMFGRIDHLPPFSGV